MPAYAAKWELASFNSNAVFTIDASSVAPIDNFIKVWVNTSYKKEQKLELLKKTYVSDKSLWYLDCKGKRVAIVSSTSYNATGEVQNSYTVRFLASMLDDIAPETVGEDILNFVCTGDYVKKGGEGSGSKRKN